VAVLRGEGIDRFVDLGSGGGFPAIPLALAVPAGQFLLVESVGKKARFLDAVLAGTRLDRVGAVAPDRVESLGRVRAHRGRWPAVTARAVAGLADLIELGFPLLQPDGIVVAWKCGDPSDAAGLGGEIHAAQRALDAAAGGGSRGRPEDADGRIEVLPSLADLARRRRRPETLAAALGSHRLIVVRRGRRPLSDGWPRDPALRRRRPW
jgi:hypothetical protein